jgi:RNA polymerase sigma-70 factor (ECF subfamily)
MVSVAAEDWPQVLAAAQLGEEWALTRLYREEHPPMLAYLRARVRDEADDIAAEVWIQAGAALPAFVGGREDFRKLLFTIARRRTIDAARKAGRRRTSAAESAVFAERPDTGADTEGVAVQNVEGDEAVRRILALLPPEQAEIVLLRVVAGLSLPEVAEVVGRKPSAVSVIQHRALRRLAQRMAEHEMVRE